ncbi:Leo1-like protein-domain-containing protein [Dissophora ornata]|nr:Leo1-like protein-domain-containing protein [Dissophora ornata]
MSDSEHTLIPEDDVNHGLFGSDDDDDDDDSHHQQQQSQQSQQSQDQSQDRSQDSDRGSPDRSRRRRNNYFSDEEDEVMEVVPDRSQQTGGKVRRSAARIQDDDDDEGEEEGGDGNNAQDSLGDLFGDEGESESEDDNRERRDTTRRRSASVDNSVSEDDSDHARKRKEGKQRKQERHDDVSDDDRELDNEYGSSQPRMRIENRASVQLPDIGFPYSTDSKIFLSRLPNFLNVDTKPFDPDTYDDDQERNVDESEAIQRIKLKVENTIRWRFKNGHDDPSIPAKEREKESNARFVRWSDGSMSLVLGDEMFQVNAQTLHNQHQFLVVHHPSELMLQTQQAFTDTLTFQPHSTQSLTHRKLTAAIAGKHVKSVKTVMVATLSDPKAAKEAIEQRELEQVRSRRKVAAERSRHARATGLTVGGLEESDGEHDEEEDEDFEAEEERRREKIMVTG